MRLSIASAFLLFASLELVACHPTNSGTSGGPDVTECSDCPPVGSGLPLSVAVDGAGNAFIVSRRKPVGAYGPSAFDITKLDADGKELWARAYGEGWNTDGNGVWAATDDAGNLVVAGQLEGIAGLGGINVLTVGETDAFALKVDGEGTAVWAKAFGTPEFITEHNVDGNTDYEIKGRTEAWGVSVGADGTVFMTGVFEHHVDFGTGPFDAAAGSEFVVALDSKDGSTQWARQLAPGRFPGVAASPGGGAVVASSFQDFDGVRLTKLDGQGADVWTKSFPGAFGSGVSDVGTDASGNVFLTGTIDTAMLDFGSGPLLGDSSFDVYVAKLSPDGAGLWGKVLHSPGAVVNSRLAMAPTGDVVIAADCQSTATIDGLSATLQTGDDVCLVRLDTTGKPLATAVYSTSLRDQVVDVALTAQGSALLVGISWQDNTPQGYRALLGL